MVGQNESKELRLARYLREFVGLRTTTIRDVSKYDTVLWLADVPQEPECKSPVWSHDWTAGESWLEVHKQTLLKMPPPPEIVKPWADEAELSKAGEEMPPLNLVAFFADEDAEVEPDEEPPLVQRHLDDHPEAVAAYERFRPTWQAWSTEYRRRQRIQHVYATLFRLHTQLRKQGEIVEVILGIGLLEWRIPIKGRTVSTCRHVLSARVDLKFDPQSGIIRVECASSGADLQIEDDMLEAELRPDRAQTTHVEDQLREIGDEIWDRELLDTALKSWVGSLHADAEWSASLSPVRANDSKPRLTFAPAIVLRKRGQRGMIRIYDSLIDRLNKGNETPPAGWKGLVDDHDDRDDIGPGQIDGPKNTRRIEPPEETWFPLPTNREQRRIVDALRKRRGVLVQGPPGTGKSHTIANLVCHLLATDKRLLITAETGRALQVVKDKLPEEIRPLCVCLLGQGGDSFAELNASVQAITNRHSSWRPGAYDDRVVEIDQELDAARRALAEIDTELGSLRENETITHSLLNGLYKGSASQIAERVSDEREQYGWLCVPLSSHEEPPLRNEELLEWLRIRRTYDAQAIAEAELRTVESGELPDPSDFAAAVQTERAALDAFDQVAELKSNSAYDAINRLDANTRASLRTELGELEDLRQRMERTAESWAADVVSDILSDRRAAWAAMFDRSQRLASSIARDVNAIHNSVLWIADGIDPRKVWSDISIVQRHFSMGGGWKTFGIFTPNAVKAQIYLTKDVRIDGQGLLDMDRLNAARAHLDMRFDIAELEHVWADIGGLPHRADPEVLIAEISEHIERLGLAIQYGDRCRDCSTRMATSDRMMPAANWLEGAAAEYIQLLDASAIADRLSNCQEQVENSLTLLNSVAVLHDCHPIVATLQSAVTDRNPTVYSEAYSRTREIEEARVDQGVAEGIESSIYEFNSELAACVLDSLVSEEWDARFSDFKAAWRWASVEKWLRKRSDYEYQATIWMKRNDTTEKIGRLLAESASLRAWTHFFNRLSPREAAALKSWREAVKAMGKGTGRSAKIERLRREAREYMDQCRKAIPVWIMPRYLVAEMAEPAPGLYDTVIVDEASQLGVESLFLFFVAKKMVVVGDDQQISPYGVGIPDEAIAALQAHFLDGIPHRHALSPQSSLYGNAKIRFGENIVLREHFRCMPEIIQFSNDLCYASNGTPLDPLRAYPADRLQPIVVRHVAAGYRTGGTSNAINEPEADAIIAQIMACLEDPRYAAARDGNVRTMGVISLQGEAQAKLIERKLLEHIEPEVIDERRLICGDAYAFQGDERHTIFLSMVAAPNERIGTLANDSARQRFNVAASRAQDQLWLFHTPTLDDLSARCMRYRLLSYMLSPEREITSADNQKFDSRFERDVFDILSARGYHVRTQVCVGDPTNHRYRIDLVVEGMQGRLAVECDGDEWHGPERYEQDMARQRDLERAGWQFIRIRGGDFYRNREQAMGIVWEELERLGIKPGGIDESAAPPPAPAR